MTAAHTTMTDSSVTSGASADEQQLIRDALRGDREAFGELTERCRPGLISRLRRRVGSVHDAEDIAQQAMLRAYEKLESYDARYRFSTWLFTIALRLATDEYRKSARRPTVPLQDGDILPSTSIEDRVDVKDRAANLWVLARNKLTANQYRAMQLRYNEEQTVSEIARTMRKTRVHVRVLLHRARQRLVAEMKEC